MHNRWGAPRVYFSTAIAVLFLISQLFLINTTQVGQLWRASAALGLAYGGMFGLLPVVTYEWFGLKHYSEVSMSWAVSTTDYSCPYLSDGVGNQNWGYVSIAPVIAGNIFSLAFGKNLDSHASSPTTAESRQSIPSHTALLVRGGLPSELLCYQGRECYVDSLRMTILACIAAIFLSIYAGWLDRRKAALKAIATARVHWTEDERRDEL